MRELWVRVDPSMPEEKKGAFIAATSAFCSAHVVDPADVDLARGAGSRIVVSPGRGDILLVDSVDKVAQAKKRKKPVCFFASVGSGEDVERAVGAARASADYVAVRCPDWKVIPLENLVAEVHGRSRLMAWVSDAQEARLALEALEVGADGVVAEVCDLRVAEGIYEELKGVRTRAEEREASERIALLPARVVELRPLGSGARVCVDTCDMMREGEGMLVGCQSSGLFLVQAEVHESPYVEPRPFRVNAGPAALYVLAPGGRTRYLSELKAGDEVLIVDREGRSRTANICRVKIEQRPLMLIEAECQGRRVKTVVQNAETIRLVTEGGHRSISDLKPGDTVLVHLEEGGRHFGALVKEETVIER